MSTATSAPEPYVVRATQNVGALEPVWREFERTAVGHVFQTYDFTSAWCSHVARARGVDPVVATVEAQDGRMLALLPLGVRRRAGTRTVEWLGGEQADYHSGLYSPEFLTRLSVDRTAFDAFVKDVIAAIGGADLLHFVQMPAEQGKTTNPFLLGPTYPNANGAHATRLLPDWETYYAAKRKSGWRRTDRSKERRFAELGEITFDIATDAATTDEILAALFEQKRLGLARIGVDDMFAPHGVREFYRQIAHDRLEGKGYALLSALRCGGAIAATSLGFAYRGTYYYVLHSYDLDTFAEHSPGRQLMYRLMRWCFENGIEIFDFTIGDEGYKDNWCEISLQLVDAAMPLTARGSMASRVLRVREQAKRRIKADPTLWSATVKVRKVLLNLRRP